jgi:hypothetical protein
MTARYPVPRTELDPRVVVRSTDSWMELSARFLVPVRTARTAKDELTRRVHARLERGGIEIGTETAEVRLRREP